MAPYGPQGWPLKFVTRVLDDKIKIVCVRVCVRVCVCVCVCYFIFSSEFLHCMIYQFTSFKAILTVSML